MWDPVRDDWPLSGQGAFSSLTPVMGIWGGLHGIHLLFVRCCQRLMFSGNSTYVIWKTRSKAHLHEMQFCFSILQLTIFASCYFMNGMNNDRSIWSDHLPVFGATSNEGWVVIGVLAGSSFLNSYSVNCPAIMKGGPSLWLSPEGTQMGESVCHKTSRMFVGGVCVCVWDRSIHEFSGTPRILTQSF